MEGASTSDEGGVPSERTRAAEGGSWRSWISHHGAEPAAPAEVAAWKIAMPDRPMVESSSARGWSAPRTTARRWGGHETQVGLWEGTLATFARVPLPTTVTPSSSFDTMSAGSLPGSTLAALCLLRATAN